VRRPPCLDRLERALVIATLLASCGVGAEHRAPRGTPPDGMIAVPGGLTHFGGDDPAREPSYAAEVAPFFLDRAPVSVADFARFAAAHGWTTRAETAGEGAVMDLASGEWTFARGATYARPFGDAGAPAAPDHPATQVSLADAVAYCEAQGARLPTEREWEHAARNARDDRGRYPWGDAIGDTPRANVWQGSFPEANTLADGFLFTSPIGTFPATPLGFVDLVGNAWQWTSSSFEGESGARVIRGGSFLCDDRVCHGARIGARQSAREEETFFHLGFRCAHDEAR
jgi:sulfatase modifying factor 1